jgi:hypothetical protein
MLAHRSNLAATPAAYRAGHGYLAWLLVGKPRGLSMSGLGDEVRLVSHPDDELGHTARR